jgi:hypothetical protein
MVTRAHAGGSWKKKIERSEGAKKENHTPKRERGAFERKEVTGEIHESYLCSLFVFAGWWWKSVIPDKLETVRRKVSVQHANVYCH